MTEIRTEIEIAASSERVWRVLTDFAAYPEWNTVMWLVGGEIRKGARLRVRIRMPGGLDITFRPTVCRTEPGRELCWKGRLPARLLEGEHSLTIEPLAHDRVRFVHREVYSGLLTSVYMWLVAKRIRRAYEKMNSQLKSRAERIPP